MYFMHDRLFKTDVLHNHNMNTLHHQGATGGNAQLREEHQPPNGTAPAADDARRARPRQRDRHPQGGHRRRLGEDDVASSWLMIMMMMMMEDFFILCTFPTVFRRGFRLLLPSGMLVVCIITYNVHVQCVMSHR